MRRKLWIFALIICLCIPSIFSCKKKENSGKNDSSVYTIVYENTKLGLDVAESIKDELTSICDVSIVDANAQKKEREIVVGKTDRAISQRAYACLEKINIESETEHRYVIYSDGTNVAIAYDFDSYDVGAAAKSALDIFIKDFIEGKDKLAFGNGILNSGVVDFIEYQSALDEIKKEEEWVALENAIDPKYSEDIISALRTLYSIYSKDVVTWYANLYEPSICVCNGACEGTVNCGGGGFYYSNSARDTVGYLPDVESTRQALNFISASGIATSMGGQSYVDFIPESMKKQIITFIRGLQDENGYFYHPQWGKELTDSQISRRARDLNWSTKTLTDLGVSPRYDTPNGIKGDGTATPVSALTSRLGSSAVSAVSFVMPAASSYVAPHLKDDTSFKAYLNSLPIETESYEVGNELASQAGQIIARDRVLKSEGKKYSLVDIAIEWLNSKQNPETGTWDAKSDYHATNGLMKISCFYNDVGAYLPNADKAVASALFSMTTDEDPYNVCCIYNNWYTIGNVIDNIRDHGGDSAAAEVAKVRELLYAQGAESIIASAQKLLLFKKLDGSFSYKQEYSSYTSQGMPVCEPYTNEGDVNATDICIEGTLNNIFKSLGLKSYFVHFLGKADAIKYLMILENLQPVIKDEITANTDYITFDDDKVGEVPVEVTPTLRSSLASLGVVKSNRGEGKVLRFSSPADSGNGNSISFTCSTASQKCYVFESDLCIESADEGYVIQLTMGRCYMLAFRIADGKLNLWDSSNTSSTARIETELGVAPKIGQWFNLKVEYYVGDDENVRIIVYYNGKPTAVSNNYYDNTASRVETGYGKPSSSYTGVTISTISSRSSVLLMDNVALYKNSKIYSVPVGDLYQNVDEVKNAENVFGFDTAENETDFPDELTVNGEGVVITDHNLDKALAFTASGKGSVLVPFARRSIGARCDLYDFEIVIDESSVDSYLDVRLRENNSGQKSVTAFRIEVKDGYAVICDAPDGEVTETYDSVKIPLGESVRVTFEYFEREHLTLIYINGILCTASKAHSSYGKQYIPGMLEFSVGGTEGLVTIDNIRAEKVLRQLSDALKPSDDATIHDFEKTDFDAILSGDASIEHIGTSNVVSIPNGGKIVLPIEKNGVVTNSVYVTLDLNILGEGDLGVYYLAFADNAGLPVHAIGIQREGNKIYFHEYSVSGILAPSFYVDSTDKELNLTVRLYLEENEVQIFVGDKCVAVSSVFYNDDAQNRTPEKIVISGISGNSKLTVDNVRTELVYSIYEARSDIFESYIDNSTKLTFDESITHRIPSHITARYATSAKTRINEFLVYSVRSKVLTFGTAAGGNDTLEITVTERSHNYNKVVFESDLYTNFISCSSGKPQYHVFFETASGIAYQFRIVLENGKLTFRDHDNTAQGVNVPSNISPNEWFNLRVEIELGDSDDFKASCYVNNKKLFESNHYYGKSENQKPYTSVERVRFYTMSAMTSDISFDNVVFAQSVKEAEPPKVESSAEILPVKGGANGIVVLMHDDGDLVSASILDSIYRKYSLRGNVSLIVDRVYDVENGVAMDSKVSAWNSLFESGRWQLTSHSKTHDFWGVDNSNGKITDEIVASQTILRNLFATQKVLTFAYPGFSAYEDTYSQEEIYGIAKDLVSEHYISGRYFGSEGAFDMGDVDWDFVIAESIGQSYLNQTLTTIDNAANGKMAIIFMHDVCQDTSSVPSQTVTYSHMDAIAQHLSSYVKDGVIWNAFYEDAVMYLKELETAKLEISKNEDVYSVSITDELPDEIYNYPLSVRIKVSEEW